MQVSQEEYYGRCYEFDTGTEIRCTQRVLGYFVTGASINDIYLQAATPDFLGNVIWLINRTGTTFFVRDHGGTQLNIIVNNDAAAFHLREAGDANGKWFNSYSTATVTV